MKLQIRLVLSLQVTLVQCLPDIYGFLSDDVTLPSGADPSWKHSSIKWSIFSNITRIATYLNGVENLNRVARYEGRLGLNLSTGDLTIRRLTFEDALQYTVDLTSTTGENRVNKATVRVMKRIPKPTVTVFELPTNKCHWLVQCQSSAAGVLLSWGAAPAAANFSCKHTGADGLPVAFLDLLHSGRPPVDVTCVSRRGAEEASSSVRLTCGGDDREPTVGPNTRARYLLVFLAGLALGVIALFLYRRFGESVL
ncbi:uncharacterized protein AB9W97_008895 [Spinachia spinachia]